MTGPKRNRGKGRALASPARAGKRARGVWASYLKLWETLNGWRLFFFFLLHYTLLFFVLQRGVFSVFYETQNHMILRSDGIPNYFSNLLYINKTFRDSIHDLLSGKGWTAPFYNFQRGFVKPSPEFEPVELLAVLCPPDKIDALYDLLVLLRLYLAGATFSVMGFYFQQRPLAIMMGAISYSFSGFAFVSGIGHPFFMGPMILLPLLVIGAEQILQGKRSWLFTAVVSLALFSSLYFSCMLAILIVLYLFVRYFCSYAKNGVKGFAALVGRMVLFGVLGILISGVTVLPSLLQLIGTGRIGRTAGLEFQYPSAYFHLMISHFIVTPQGVGANTLLGFSVLAIPSLALLYTSKTSRAKNLKVLFAILTIMLCIPHVAYVMSGFNAIGNRWCFAYALCVSAVIMFALPDLLTASRPQLALTGGFVLVYAIICYVVVEHKYYSAEAMTFLLLACLLVATCYIAGKSGLKAILPLCLVITCLSVWYSGVLLYDPAQGDYTKSYSSKDEPYLALNRGQYASLGQCDTVSQDTTTFRVTGSDISRGEINSSFYSGLNGLSYYSSLYFHPYIQLQEALETPQQGFNILNHGVGAGAPILSMYSVKYYAARQNNHSVWPYGFEKIEEIKNGNNVDVILKNPYVLPFGYTYDHQISLEQFEQLNPLEKQEAMLQGVVLHEADSNLPVTDAVCTVSQIPVNVEATDGLQWADGTLTVTQEKATLTLTFQGVPNTDTYLRVKNLDLTDGTASLYWLLTVSTEDTSNRAMFTSDGQFYNNGAKTQLLYLGNSPEGYTSCTLTFPQKGTFHLEELEIWCQSMDDYSQRVEALRAEALENVEFTTHGLTGTISTSQDKFLCFSIPYDRGWSVYVDGKRVKPVQANIGFMGIDLSAGEHMVELKYNSPGREVGAILSCIGLAGVVALVLVSRKRKKEGGK